MSGEKRFRSKIENYIFKDKWTYFYNKIMMHGNFDQRVAEILDRLNDFDNQQRGYVNQIFS